MKSVIEELHSKIDEHLNKIDQHKLSEESLKLEYNGAVNDMERDRVSEKLLITLEAIEYHKGSAKAYSKAMNMIDKKITKMTI